MNSSTVLKGSIISASIVGAIFAFGATAFAATITVSSNSTNAGYEASVLKNADRLGSLLNTDGGINWTVTDATAGTNSTTYNTQGVSAQVFLDAFSITGEQKYLTDAESIGGYLLTASTSSTPDAGGSDTSLATGRQNPYNIVFLQNLAVASGDSAYSDGANAMLNAVFNSSNYWTNTYPGTCTSSGCTADQLMAADEARRGAPASTPDGIVAFDLTPYVNAEVTAGNAVLANQLEQDIVGYATSTSFTCGAGGCVGDYSLGISRALSAAVAVGDTSNEATLLATLQGIQDPSTGSIGTVSHGQVQATAYGLAALSAAGDSTDAAKAAAYLSTNFGYTDSSVTYSGWKETDGTEYSEDDSEAAHGLSLVLGSTGGTFYSIQNAVNAANSGDTVNVGAGTFDSFSVVNKTGITITGAGVGQTVIAPTTLVDSGVADKYDTDMHVSVFVNGSTGITLQGMTIKSTSAAPASSVSLSSGVNNAIVFWNGSSGTIANSAITGIYTINGAQTGQGIAVDASTGTDNLTVNNVTISGFQKNGIQAIDGNGAQSASTDTINLTVSSSTITGAGPTTAIAQNGIVAWNRGGGTVNASVSGTTISGFDYTPAATPADYATGILAYGGGKVTSVRNSTFGSNPQYNISTNSGAAPAIDATQNYWGSASGPATTTLDSNVSFSPWFTDATMTTLQYATSTNVSGNTTTTTGSATTTEDTSSSSGTTTVQIAPNTTITGDASWNGTIEALTATTTNVTVTADSGQTATVVEAIEIGNPNQSLTLSNAARIEFAGQAGKLVGWTINGTFTPITATCADDTQATNDTNLAARGDCRISNDGSGNLIVWTKHFTTFETYTETPIVTSGGGGGGGGGGNGPISGSIGGSGGAVALPNNGSTGGSVGGSGQVLGASTYNFTTDLTIGSTGADVTALQQILISAGFSIPLLTSNQAAYGYFGVQTRAAVAAYQSAHGITPTAGYFGPITRASFNLGVTPTGADEQRALLLQSLQQQLAAILAQIAAMKAAGITN